MSTLGCKRKYFDETDLQCIDQLNTDSINNIKFNATNSIKHVITTDVKTSDTIKTIYTNTIDNNKSTEWKRFKQETIDEVSKQIPTVISDNTLNTKLVGKFKENIENNVFSTSLNLITELNNQIDSGQKINSIYPFNIMNKLNLEHPNNTNLINKLVKLDPSLPKLFPKATSRSYSCRSCRSTRSNCAGCSSQGRASCSNNYGYESNSYVSIDSYSGSSGGSSMSRGSGGENYWAPNLF